MSTAISWTVTDKYKAGLLETADKYVVEVQPTDGEVVTVDFPKFKGKRRKGRKAKAYQQKALDNAVAFFMDELPEMFAPVYWSDVEWDYITE